MIHILYAEQGLLFYAFWRTFYYLHSFCFYHSGNLAVCFTGRSHASLILPPTMHHMTTASISICFSPNNIESLTCVMMISSPKGTMDKGFTLKEPEVRLVILLKKSVKPVSAKNGQSEPLKTEFFEPLKKSFQIML